VPLLRTYGALLAGVNRFPWSRFLFWNGSSAVAWATTWGVLAFVFGNVLRRYESIATLAALGVALSVTVAAGIVIRRRRSELRAAAERAFPGDIERIAA
jgi:membrane-associated protein